MVTSGPSASVPDPGLPAGHVTNPEVADSELASSDVAALDAGSSFRFVTQYFPPEVGAAQVRLGSLTAELRRRGHRVDVITAPPSYPHARLREGWPRRPLLRTTDGDHRTIRVWAYPDTTTTAGRLVNYASFGATSLVGLVLSRPADWTVVEYPSLFGALPAVVACRLRRRPVVVNVADLWVDVAVAVGALPAGPIARGAAAVEGWMLRQADVVTVVTEGFRGAIEAKGVDPARIAWLPNGADTDLYSPGPVAPGVREELGAGPDEAIVLYAGTHGLVHGLDVVLDAAALLADAPIRFSLVGDGTEKAALAERARAEGLANVTFVDAVPPERVADHLRAATVGLATVRAGDAYRTIRSAKAFPVMASATPIVYSAGDEGSTLVTAAGAGIATPPGDTTALADAVRALVSDPERAHALGAAGRAWVESEMSWRSLTDRWLADLQRIGPRRRPTRASRRAGSNGPDGARSSRRARRSIRRDAVRREPARTSNRAALDQGADRSLSGQAVVFIGTYAGQKGGQPPGQDELLAARFADEGALVGTASTVRQPVLRAAHQVATVARWARRADLVVMSVFSGRSFAYVDVITRLCRLLDVPIVLVLRGGNLPEFAANHPDRVDSTLRRADLVVAPSAYLVRAFTERGHTVDCIPNLIAIDRYEHRHREKARPRLLWMRTFHEVYDPTLAIEVLARVRKEHPEATLTMAGADRGLLDATRERARALGVDDAVTFPGFLDDAGKRAAFAGHDLYLNTNAIDNMPVSVLEVAATGIVPVCTDVGGIPDLLTDGVDAQLVPAGDADAMAAAVVALLDDPDEMSRLSAGARALAERFTWPEVAPLWHTAITNLT